MAEQRNNDFQESRTERETQKLAEAISRSLMMAEKAIASNQRSENASGTGMGGKDSVELVYLVLSKFKYILLSAVLCAVLVGTYVFFIMDPVYAATAKLYIMGQDSSSILADLQIGSYLTKDYQEVFQTWEVHEMVREELNLPYTYKDMQEMLTTGVGGGMLRDVLIDAMPKVLRKRIYAVASIVGAIGYYLLLRFGVDQTLSTIIITVLITALRILATVFKWNMPQAKL